MAQPDPPKEQAVKMLLIALLEEVAVMPNEPWSGPIDKAFHAIEAEFAKDGEG